MLFVFKCYYFDVSIQLNCSHFIMGNIESLERVTKVILVSSNTITYDLCLQMKTPTAPFALTGIVC